LLNIGTGSQISLITKEYCRPPVGEVRPYLDGAYLVAGCPLCGGSSYRLLKNFFASVAGEVSYDTMNAWALSALEAEVAAPVVEPTFRGTREDPMRRAGITGLSEENFNAPALTLGVLRGISSELKTFYADFSRLPGKRTMAVGAGNAVRQNEALRCVLREDFGCEIAIPVHTEEAAFGAARAAAQAHTGENFAHWIRYESEHGADA
jgi:sedoheptulokinase